MMSSPPPIDLYRSMSTPDLQLLQAAFVLDVAREADDVSCVEFCYGRIAAIDQVLRERDPNWQPFPTGR